MIGPIITAQITATCDGVRFDHTVSVQRQQLHTLGENQLARAAGTGAVLPVAGQDIGTLGHQGLLDLLWTRLHQLGDALFCKEVHHRVEVTVPEILSSHVTNQKLH